VRHCSLLRLFFFELCSYSRSSLNVLLCLSDMSVCVICRWCWVSAVFFMWFLFRGVLQCDLLRIVFICWDFGGMACVGLEGQWYGFLEKAGFCLVEGYGVGDLWLMGFSKASMILMGDMLCSLFRWFFW